MNNREGIVAAVKGGLSFGQCADRFGVTRNTVAGLVHRANNPTPRKAKGDHTRCRGERQPAAKLTDDDVRHIRNQPCDIPCKILGNLYGVSGGIISRVRNRKLWKHVT